MRGPKAGDRFDAVARQDRDNKKTDTVEKPRKREASLLLRIGAGNLPFNSTVKCYLLRTSLILLCFFGLAADKRA